ncbi:MAG TPA: type 4a pilus biogenesis protein PilO [Candidatus Paceibacterota bacterium]
MNRETISRILKNFSPFFYVRLIMLFVFIAVILFMKGKINSISQDVNRTLNSIAAQTANLNNSARLKQQYDALHPFVPKIKNLIPDSDKLPIFVADIEAVSEKVGVKSSVRFGLEPVPSSAVTNTKEIQIFLNSVGSGKAFVAFLKELATMPYFVRLNDVEIDAAVGLDSTSTLKANGTLFLK